MSYPDYLKLGPEDCKKLPLIILDFDGVITNDKFMDTLLGVFDDEEYSVVCVTGRCYDEASLVTEYMARELGIGMATFYNPISLCDRGRGSIQSRTISGKHKASVILKFLTNGAEIEMICEDDPLQIDIIEHFLRVCGHPEVVEKIVYVRNDHSEL